MSYPGTDEKPPYHNYGENFLLRHTIGANTGGQVGSVMAAAVMLSMLKGREII